MYVPQSDQVENETSLENERTLLDQARQLLEQLVVERLVVLLGLVQVVVNLDQVKYTPYNLIGTARFTA